LGGIAFKNNRVISDAEALRNLFPVNDGDIFSGEKIKTGLENLSKAYGQMGYLNFTAVPETRFDDGKKSIYLDVDVDEGRQFYAGGISTLGLDESARHEVMKDLLIAPGQIYNSRLWGLSLQKVGSVLPDCGCAEGQPLSFDERSAIVTLTIDFRPCLKNP
jgi:outer membrane protein insertion porin family